uniref:Uncharacterized protein n=1 Tax=Trichogramma kaykai TaxID=54128 RepID=A0ABD2WUG1_9HYME
MLVSYSAGALRRLRENFNLEIEKERLEFLRRLHPVIDRMVEFPSIRGIFSTDEIESLLCDFINHWSERDHYADYRHHKFVELLVKDGYSDEPPPAPRPLLLLRTTPLHRVARRKIDGLVHDLFRIYRSFEANYVDEFGLLHFHVACQYGRQKVVEKFLELGQVDVNCPVTETGDTPLHLALACQDDYNKNMATLLLNSGADPNLADAKGCTCLHIISSHYPSSFLEMVFGISDDKQRKVEVNARNKSGNTPLHLALASGNAATAKLLLRRGADPNMVDAKQSTALHLICERSDDVSMKMFFKVNEELNQSVWVDALNDNGRTPLQLAALLVMKLFDKHKLFEKSGHLEKFCLNDEEFASKAKELMINPSLSLYELILLPAEEVAKIFTYADYLKIDKSQIWRGFSDGNRNACNEHLCEMASRGFFQQWALDYFMDLIH